MADIKAELRAQMEKIQAAFLSKKADEMINYYTDDCRLLAPGAPMVEGKEALKGLFGAMAALLEKIDKADFKLVDAVSMGDQATSISTSVSYDKDGNELDTNRAMTHWKKVNGNWHIHWTAFNRTEVTEEATTPSSRAQIRGESSIALGILSTTFNLISEMADIKAELLAEIQKLEATLLIHRKTDVMINFYTDDCQFISPGAPIVEGKEALKVFLDNMAGVIEKIDKIHHEVVDAVAMGDQATSIMTVISHDKDGNVLYCNRAMIHWKKVNGNWCMHWTAFNSEKPMPATQ